MKLSGYSHIYSGLGQQAFPMPGQNRGRSFLDEVISATMTSSLEKVKKTKEQEAEDAQLRALYAYLSAASQSVLERVRDGKGGVRKDEWLTLCRELKDAGAISQSEFDYTRGDIHMIPLGYYDDLGNFIQYDTPPMLKDQLLHMQEQAQGSTGAWLASGGWTGDPLEYLDLWASELEDWQKDLARQRAADGSPKFSDFSPITSQVDACRKVADLVEGLSGLSGRRG